jgi:Flp pilus assembly protein TadD
LFILLAFCVLVYRQLVLSKDFGLSQVPGLTAYARGQFTDAIELFRVAELRFMKKPSQRSMLALLRGYAELGAGNVDRAIDAFVTAEKCPSILFSSGFRAVAGSELAISYAVSGDLSAAEKWLIEVRLRLEKNDDNRLYLAARLRVGEALLAMRRGDASRCIALLETHRLEIRQALNANAMRTVDVLRAFAEAQEGPRSEGLVNDCLKRIEPCTKGEFAYLGTRWPEMQTFLVAHALQD